MRQIFKKINLAIGIFCLLSSVNDLLANQGNAVFPLQPRVSFWGLGGNGVNAKLDGMFPLYGNDCGLLYLDGQAKAMDTLDNKKQSYDDFALGVGAGYRKIVNGYILGGYVFGDYNNARNDFDFWTVSPGLELMSSCWSLRANGYINVDRKTKLDKQHLASSAGDDRFVSFNGHMQFDQFIQQLDVTGDGLDVEAGFHIPFGKTLNKYCPNISDSWIYLGGYHFNMKNSKDITGLSARAEIPFNRYVTAVARYSYDDIRKSCVVAGLQINLGGFSRCRHTCNLKTRMLDPIERDIGTFASGTQTPTRRVIHVADKHTLMDNIWFFNANGGDDFDAANGINQCTFEHPCIGTAFDQANINEINNITANAKLYFNPGSYDISTPAQLVLNNGQSMFGRTEGYKMPAYFGPSLPVFIGSLDLGGNNTLEAFQLINNVGSKSIGITANNISDITISHVTVGDEQGVTNDPNFLFGVNLTNATAVKINDSIINSHEEQTNAFIFVSASISSNTSEFCLENSQINQYAKGIVTNPNWLTKITSFGVIVVDSTATLNNNSLLLTNIAEVTAINSRGVICSGGISIQGNSTVNSTDDLITLNNYSAAVADSSKAAVTNSAGIYIDNTSGVGSSVNLVRDTVNIDNTASTIGDNSKATAGGANAFGVTFGDGGRGNAGIIVDSNLGANTQLDVYCSSFNINNSAVSNGNNSTAVAGGASNELGWGNSGLFIKANNSSDVQSKVKNSQFTISNNATTTGTNADAMAGGAIFANADNTINSGNAGFSLYSQAANIDLTLQNNVVTTTNNSADSTAGRGAITGGLSGPGAASGNVNAGNASISAANDGVGTIGIIASDNSFVNNNTANAGTDTAVSGGENAATGVNSSNSGVNLANSLVTMSLTNNIFNIASSAIGSSTVVSSVGVFDDNVDDTGTYSGNNTFVISP